MLQNIPFGKILSLPFLGPCSDWELKQKQNFGQFSASTYSNVLNAVI
jgi:hypothetical protein